MRAVPRVGRNGLPECPWEIKEVVELYAREWDRTATVHFAPTIGWFVRFEARSNDPRWLAYREGRAAEPPTEDVFFHEDESRKGQFIPGAYGQRYGDFRPIDIVAKGASWVREFLEAGNSFSGRGKFGAKSLEEIARDALYEEQRATQKERERQKEDARLMARDTRRHRLKIPVVRVGLDLKKQG